MLQSRLNDAAITLYNVLSEAGIKHATFGGFPIGALGGLRESKDIDCIASANKVQIVAALNGKKGFAYLDQSREDYVAFLWSDKPSRERAVLVEIFVTTIPGFRYEMQNIQPIQRQVTGQDIGVGTIAHLDPSFIFKGKLHAAATRGKLHDSTDLCWLETKYANQLTTNRGMFNIEYVGLAIKRYPDLEPVFHRIGIDTKAKVAEVELNKLQPGDVQKGLLG